MCAVRTFIRLIRVMSASRGVRDVVHMCRAFQCQTRTVLFESAAVAQGEPRRDNLGCKSGPSDRYKGVRVCGACAVTPEHKHARTRTDLSRCRGGAGPAGRAGIYQQANAAIFLTLFCVT